MKLNNTSIMNKEKWEELGFTLPKFDVDKMVQETKENPEWIHFGAGNIFRAFPAVVCQNLLNQGIINTGIIVAEGYDYEIIDKIYEKYDNLGILVTLKPDGELDKTIVASIAEALHVDTKNKSHWDRLSDVFRKPSLKMVSFTITEKGYLLSNDKQEFYPDVNADFNKLPSEASSYIGKLVALLYERFNNGKYPVTLVSMDNCSHNGTKLKQAVVTFAKEWVNNNKVASEFLDYVTNNISYPITMIDKITPRPAESVMKTLDNLGVEEMGAVVTSKNTYVAPFVNAEEPQYLVIEDIFVNGRIPLNEGGILYTDKDTVNKVEKMKVCTCLNPLHTALAIFGCLLSYDKISEEMKDKELVSLIEKIGYVEGLPVVVNPGIIDPKSFIDEVLKKRLPNPYMPDTPQRIACDTSQKLSIRFGETIKAYQKDSNLGVDKLKYIPLVLAGWCRYLMAIDDKGNKFELSPDPLLPNLTPLISNIKLGQSEGVREILKNILSKESIFGVDLYEVGIGVQVEDLFLELNKGVDAVRNTLKKYL